MKKIPNPFGKLGSPEHKEEVDEIEEGFGLRPQFHPYNKTKDKKWKPCTKSSNSNKAKNENSNLEIQCNFILF